MKQISRLVAVLFLVSLALPLGAAEDFTGKWSGSFSPTRPDGTVQEHTIVLNLTHKGDVLSGTAGPSQEEQWKITNGIVKGNDLTFEVAAEDGGHAMTVKFALKFAEGRIKGEATADAEGNTITAKVDAARVK